MRKAYFKMSTKYHPDKNPEGRVCACVYVHMINVDQHTIVLTMTKQDGLMYQSYDQYIKTEKLFQLLVLACTCSIHSLIHSFIRSLIHSFIYIHFIHLYSFIHTLLRLRTCSRRSTRPTSSCRRTRRGA
jgi:hypothetical protein